MTLNSPLDLEQILVVDLAGNPEVFSFVAIILYAFAAAKFNLPNKVSLTLFGLFTVIMAAYLQGLFVLVNLVTGLVIYYNFGKLAK